MTKEPLSPRAKRMLTPRTWETPDAKGFLAYAIEHYLQSLKLADDIIKKWDAYPGLKELGFRGILDKLAAPLVYLYESWEVLAPEEKAKYSAELAKIHEEGKALAEKLLPGVPAVPAVEAEKVPKLDIAAIEELSWINFQTKTSAAKGEAGWIFSNTKGAEDLKRALDEIPGHRLDLGEYEYKFSGLEQQFIARRPRKV